MTQEKWRPIKGYEGIYEVNPAGDVRNIKRNGHLLKACAVSHGYRAVTLHKEGTGKTMLLHRLVASAFIPNPETKPQVNHINGNKADNRAENLEWCTAYENHRHAEEKGLIPPRSSYKPTPADVMIRAREGKGWTQKELADRAGVSVHTIKDLEGNARYIRERCVSTIHKIAKVLGMSIETLAEYEGEEVNR